MIQKHTKPSTIHFEHLKRDHFQLVHRWFNLPHVQDFYSLRAWTYDEVCKKLEPYLLHEKGLSAFIIYFEKDPIGYIQSYPLKKHPWENQEISEDMIQESAGFDLFIGEEKCLHQGLGSGIVSSFLETHIWPRYRYCFVDPDVQNQASIRLFQKCGFEEHQEIEYLNPFKQKVRLKLMKRGF